MSHNLLSNTCHYICYFVNCDKTIRQYHDHYRIYNLDLEYMIFHQYNYVYVSLIKKGNDLNTGHLSVHLSVWLLLDPSMGFTFFIDAWTRSNQEMVIMVLIWIHTKTNLVDFFVSRSSYGWYKPHKINLDWGSTVSP